jgi:Protein of unknown function (DUF1566)
MEKMKFGIIFTLLTMSLIFASYGGVNAETKLRNTPEKLNKMDIETLVTKSNFFDKELNPKGEFSKDFVDNGDGTITDRATGLMWEKGASKEVKFQSATKYVKKLNKKKFVGHDDWRLPTIEELYSLLEPNKNKKRYIDPVFASKPSLCWSIDDSDWTKTEDAGHMRRKLIIDYEKGKYGDAYTGKEIGGASTFRNYWSYVRAVRSTK